MPEVDDSRGQLRGSSLLLAGRVLSAALNFLSQILVVRYLSTRDYGALAFALAAVALFDGISSLGLRRGIGRFAPVYLEERDFPRLFGSIGVAFATIATVSALAIGVLALAPDALRWLVHDDDLAVPLLLVLIFLIPIEAVDDVLITLFASFAKSRAIFVRKHLAAPGLKLLAISVPIAIGGDVLAVAHGTLASALLGSCISAALLLRLLRERGLWRELDLRHLRFPAREMLAFGIPLMSTDLVNTAILSGATLVLGAYHDASEVAQFRAALPIARLNLLVMTTFQLLYMPQAARLAARGDPVGVQTLYWRTAAWISVLSFPIFALTGSFAREAMLTCYGERYADAWPQLFALSLACYFNVVTGFNGLTLLALGRLRFVLATNALSIGISLALAFALIPRWGAFGAALATALALVGFNAIKQLGLRFSAGMNIFDWNYTSLYAGIATGAAALLALQLSTDERWLALPATAAVSLSLLRASRDKLRIAETFPELLRVPVLRWLASDAPRGGGHATTRPN